MKVQSSLDALWRYRAETMHLLLSYNILINIIVELNLQSKSPYEIRSSHNKLY